MAIKKRSSLPKSLCGQPDPNKLHIVAKPKKPLPPARMDTALAGDAVAKRRLGLVALDMGAKSAEEGMSVTDILALLRTPYDPKNNQEVAYRNRIRGRGTAITAMCVNCQGSRKGVTECSAIECPLWAFRFGSDPFYGKKR